MQPLLMEHAPPAVQLQLPLASHALFVPVPVQVVPAGFAARPTEHTGVPVAQLVVPVSHPPFVEQAVPAVQVHPPAPSQKLLPPQLTPAATFPVRFEHTGEPVVHEIVPVLHPLVHAPPATHVQPPLASQ